MLSTHDWRLYRKLAYVQSVDSILGN